MDELKPCPFCGCTQVEIFAEDELYQYLYMNYFAKCSRCGASTGHWHTYQNARDMWNRRAGEVEMDG